MSRPTLLINELKREYLACSNPEKENIVKRALDEIKSLVQLPKV